MVSIELVKLGQDVASVLVRAKALGEDSVAAILQMALDELLVRLEVEHDRLAQVNSEQKERGDE